ncbi:hypothetical protein ANO11243_092020 [Dothideomycetidae sp. 11243]|nr:hypothetical protein ANO11243_092020 [fungal sp. No.11243]
MASNQSPKAVSISPERIQQVEKTVAAFVQGFTKEAATSQDQSKFFAAYQPDVEWTDHAFLIKRVGHNAVQTLRNGFVHCNDPFRAEVKEIHVTARGAVFEQLWVGRMSNDIVGKDGVVRIKASGKEFECPVCMVMEIDDEGRITKIDEYYNKRWDEGVNPSGYTVMKG